MKQIHAKSNKFWRKNTCNKSQKQGNQSEVAQKLIQLPHTWLVSGGKERQARWHILFDFPRLNKLPES